MRACSDLRIKGREDNRKKEEDIPPPLSSGSDKLSTVTRKQRSNMNDSKLTDVEQGQRDCE